MQKKDYSTHSIDDFIWDEDFRKWVNEPSVLSNKYWNEWLVKNPGKMHTVAAAKQVIQSIQIKDIVVNAEEIDKEIGRILHNMDNPVAEAAVKISTDTKRGFIGIKRKRSYILPIRIAAAFILLMGIGVAFYYYLNLQEKGVMEIASGYGAIKKVLLPDSSVIVLNGNSSISFSKRWKEDQPREIWLNGEGYFTVKHLNRTKAVSPGERFLVHVKNITVEVLGTTFDIRHRRNKTVIVLSSGSIKVSYTNKRNTLIMKPGDMTTFSDDDTDSITISRTEPKEFTAWTEKKLIANNASVKDIFQYLEDNYGKKILLNDQSIMDRKIQGPIMLDNLDDALFVLSKVLNVKIYNTDSSIIIRMNN